VRDSAIRGIGWSRLRRRRERSARATRNHSRQDTDPCRQSPEEKRRLLVVTNLVRARLDPVALVDHLPLDQAAAHLGGAEMPQGRVGGRRAPGRAARSPRGDRRLGCDGEIEQSLDEPEQGARPLYGGDFRAGDRHRASLSRAPMVAPSVDGKAPRVARHGAVDSAPGRAPETSERAFKLSRDRMQTPGPKIDLP
jgi:hypothetical protein